MEYKKARQIATAILRVLEPHCSKIDVAGSVRREKPEVKDIEICVVPRETEAKDLFGTTLAKHRNLQFIQSAQSMGMILKGSLSDGRYVQILLHERINLDLFIPAEIDYQRQFAIRTGSAEYSHKVLATAWLKKGYCGTRNGLRLQIESYQKSLGNGKYEWICDRANPTLPPVWENEYDLFQWLNLKWIEPKNRNI